MAEEPEETVETPEPETPEPETPAAEAPEAETPEAETPAAEAPEAETPEAETPAAEAPEAPEAEAPAAPQTEAAPAPAEPQAALSPKERRQRARVEKAAKRPALGSRTPEERQEERRAVRARKAALRRAEREQARTKAKAAASETQPTAAREHAPGVQKMRQGVVVSDKADKTITVRIDIARRHRRYQKIVHTSRTLHVHDERNDAHAGDKVVVRESRPLSRSKRWRLVEILERAK